MVTPSTLQSPQGARIVAAENPNMLNAVRLQSPQGARIVAQLKGSKSDNHGALQSPQGARIVAIMMSEGRR